MEYFEKVYKGLVKSPLLKSPDKIIVHTIPDVSGSGKCKPYVEIVNGVDFDTIWDNKNNINLKAYQIYEMPPPELRSKGQQTPVQKMTIEISQKLKVSSDLYFRIKHKGSFKNKLICRFALNPAFVENNLAVLTRTDVDPDSVGKD